MQGYSLAIDIPGAPVRDADDAVDQVFKPVETRVAAHHNLIMGAIDECLNTKDGRLMIFAPPGSAKSTYTSVIAPTYAMGRWPGFKVILASYATGIAAKQSRKARAICRSLQYSSIWKEKPKLRDDQNAVDEWSLTNGSELMAAGLLAGITGNRANAVIIDDPVANREQADSATIRAKTYDEYIDTALSRLLPGGACIIIQTRWHEGDLAGMILPEDYAGESGYIDCRDGQRWRVLCIPAEAERADDPLGRRPRSVDPATGADIPGEFLWSEWFGKDGKHWAPWRNNVLAKRTWSALYQQRPSPDVGIHFDRRMFKMYDPTLERV